MDELISRGHIMAYFVYVLLGAAFIVTAFLNESGNTAFIISDIFFLAVTLAVLLIVSLSGVGKGKGRTFEIFFSLFYVFLSFDVQAYWGNGYLIYLLFLIQWMLTISFMKVGLLYAVGAMQAAVLALLTFLPVKMTGFNLITTPFFIVSVVALMVVAWISKNIIDMMHGMREQGLEHESSLDDLLEIVEAKHREAQRATKSKSIFLSNLSHEIRTPLNAMLGMSEMIFRESKEKEIVDYAEQINHSGEILMTLINEILDISKIESGKVEILEAHFDISDVIGDVYNIVKIKAAEKELDFKIDISDTIPRYYVGDDVRLKQIMINLLNNSVKYTTQGEVGLCIRGEMCGDTEKLHFMVTDTGSGIKEEDLANITDAFVRIYDGNNRNVEGTGLGLCIVNSFLKMMDSELLIDSKYGEGSTFHFYLNVPIDGNEPLGDIFGLINAQTTRREYKPLFTAPDVQLLNVDDTKMNHMLVEKLLSKTQVKIDKAMSGAEALELVKVKKYDLILMDHLMPDMDGIETFKRIREDVDGLNADTPIVALTANAVRGAGDMYSEIGFCDYITKPIIPKELEEKIKKIIGDK